ncbi:hypothetical protein ACSL103130_09110 [Actinomyces slackii]|uniref:Uncharacterized protein n=1 Tax=Actinomyces slackii TaxID=52774 RepID=A0A3S4UM70_9ACTO|nr:hypothetical protein [Actinomyces slackii]VEG73808.1 Uncharacterised protein [Actinomyces slackii]
MGKKASIAAVKTQVSTSRNSLGLSDGAAAKTESLVKDLSSAWKSPKAEDYATQITEVITSASALWSSLADELQDAYNAATD